MAKIPVVILFSFLPNSPAFSGIAISRSPLSTNSFSLLDVNMPGMLVTSPCPLIFFIFLFFYVTFGWPLDLLDGYMLFLDFLPSLEHEH